MIYIRIVYYQETIVALLIGFHLYSWVLAIVLLNIQIIELNLSGDGSTSFTLNYRKFCDSCHICQFFLQRIIDMLAYLPNQLKYFSLISNNLQNSLLRFLQHVTEHFAPPPREGDGEQTGGQARSAL